VTEGSATAAINVGEKYVGAKCQRPGAGINHLPQAKKHIVEDRLDTAGGGRGHA